MSARICRSLVMAAVAAATLAVPTSASAATATSASGASCAVSWGSLDKGHAPSTRALLATTRTGRHECYDRVVFEFEGAFDGYTVGYVDQVRTEPDGWVLPVTGGARLQVTLWAGITADGDGRPTYPTDHGVDVTGYKTLRDVEFGGANSIGHSAEWHSTFGIGVRARLPYRAFLLPGPGNHSRLVIDVAHRW